MAVTDIDLGNGATLTFGTSGHTFQVESMSFSGYERAMIDTSHLGTTGAMTKLASDLYDAGSFTARVQNAPTVAMPVTVQAAETVTVTWPISSSGNTTNATLAGTGNISNVTLGPLENDVLQTIEITTTWDGATDPAFTIESA
jgi:hypothetical protein